MGSMYAQIRKEQTIGSANTSRIADFDETDPYYFIVYDNDCLIAEGELTAIKLKLNEKYLYKPIKKFHRTPVNMTATIVF